MAEKSHLENYRKKASLENEGMKMHDMENDRKCTLWKIIQKSHPENDRMENAHLENDRKITPPK